jgi:hypothetical protein
MTQAAARTLPLVLSEFRNQIKIVTHDSIPYLIDYVEIFSMLSPAEIATNSHGGAHVNRRHH